ncbi:MAG: hypothetical protein CMM18_03215 [Rhodospirillaceae bacterium]|nr:hypothetical protein [Rhodospirillaceae bacterium]
MKIKSKMYNFILPIVVTISLFILFDDALSNENKVKKPLNYVVEKVVIRSEEKLLGEFYVEIADTKEKRQKGLMFRDFLNENQGMLFDFKQEEKVSFWMKNTSIPLDIIFIDKKGYIVNIYENATPFSKKVIKSKYQVRAVLEINAGLVKKLRISIGDIVMYKMLLEG